MPAIDGKSRVIVQRGGRNDGHLGNVFRTNRVRVTDGDMFVDGVGRLAALVEIQVLEYLNRCQLPLAYVGHEGDLDSPMPTFTVQLARMIPVKIIVCNESAKGGSYHLRHPNIPEGTKFEQPQVQFFYKTEGGEFRGRSIGVDNPLVLFSDDGYRMTFHHPYQPLNHERPMLEVTYDLLKPDDRKQLHNELQLCSMLALRVNEVLKAAWQRLGGWLIDFKLECGYTRDDSLVVADAPDFDSWRVRYQGQLLSSHRFSKSDEPEEIVKVYKLTQKLTNQF